MAQPFIGQIKLFAFPFNPRGYATCSGQTLAINTNQALFSILGTTYGGNGVTTFQLPDLRSRVPIHWGTGPGLSPYALGQPSGAENVTLTTQQIPQHNHAFMASTASATRRPVVGSTFADDNAPGSIDFLAPNTPTTSFVSLAPNSIGNTGGNAPHSNIQPYSATNYCIALQGVFPSRN